MILRSFDALLNPLDTHIIPLHDTIGHIVYRNNSIISLDRTSMTISIKLTLQPY